MATCSNASMVTINDKVSEGSIQITKTKETNINKQVKNSRSIIVNGCNGTICNIDDEITNSVSIVNDGGTLTIGSGGILDIGSGSGVNVTNATNVNINNQGTINASINNAVHGIKIDGNSVVENITNSGSIAGKWNGISVEGGVVKTITNTGSINGANSNGNGGIAVINSTIENLNNSGFINKVQISNNGTIGTIDNQGSINNITVNNVLDDLINQKNIGSITIQNSNSKINVITNKGSIDNIFANNNGAINTLINEKTILNSSGNGIQIDSNGKVNTISNLGLIQGSSNGIRSGGNNAVISTIINNGTIFGNNHGILSDWNGKIEYIANQGVIKTTGEAAIRANKNGIIDTIDNSGIIESSKHGILIQGNSKVQSIVNSGTIKGSQTLNGILIDSGSTVNNIHNTGLISGGSFVYQGGIQLQQQALVKTIDNDGIISGRLALINWSTLNTFNNNKLLQSQGNGIYNENSTINTINNNGTIISNQKGVFNNSTINTINNNGTIISGDNSIQNMNTINTIKNTGEIYGENAIYSSGSVGCIENFGTMLGKNKGIIIDGKINQYIKIQSNNAFVAGTTVAIYNRGTIGLNNNDSDDTIILKDGATISVVKSKNNMLEYDESGSAILNEGTIKGNINLDDGSKIIGAIYNKNTITGSIALNDKSYITSINNEKEIQGSIDLKEESYIDKIINTGTLEKGISLEKSTIGYIENSGTIKNGIKLDDSVIGSITNNKETETKLSLNNNSSVGTITNNGDMIINKDETSSIGKFFNNGNLKNTFENKDTLGTLKNSKDAILEQGLVNDNGIIGVIDNAGAITSINNTLNNKTKDDKDKGYIGAIINTGTIGKKIMSYVLDTNSYGINNSGTIDLLKNEDNAKIYGGINNSGTMSIANYGEINGGITNLGTIILSNGEVKSVGGNAEWSGGVINKSNDGYHIKNQNGGKISIDGWYFEELEYTQSNDQRLENSIIVGGNNIGGISTDKIYVNTSKLELNTIYDSSTFFSDKEGNAIGNETNNDKGIDANNIYSLSGIYKFINVPSEKGKYTTIVDNGELSGKTLAKSMIYSSRLRNINISNILREVNGKNFQTEFSQVLDMELSKKGEAYGNDADLLAELEDIFIPNKNPQATNYSFLLPYYNYSSIKIGKSIGQLSSHTTGLIGGSFKELPNDYGSIGFYVGYEDASKEQVTQRLKFDDKTYYGGLTYYGVMSRDGINQYYINASTRFDYTKTDIEKSYKNISHTVDSEAKVYGYGAEVRLGANYYNTLDIARISPEIGLSYYGMSNKNFSLIHLGGTNEHYLSEQFNFIDAVAALKIYKPLSDKLRTNIAIGSVVNLYNDAKGTLKLDKNTLESDIDTSKYYGFGQLGLSYAIADNADLSLNYAGAFTFDNTTSHTMFLKLGLWW
ncbi:hypothetical protein A0Z39_02365 [Campylobacter lari]|nr:hypothetical protein [Campylobacter lari]